MIWNDKNCYDYKIINLNLVGGPWKETKKEGGRQCVVSSESKTKWINK